MLIGELNSINDTVLLSEEAKTDVNHQRNLFKETKPDPTLIVYILLLPFRPRKQPSKIS